MPISHVQPISIQRRPDDSREQERQLRQVAEEFEAVLTATMLKEGLKGTDDAGGDSSDSGGSTYMDMTYQQLAYFIGRQGVLGIADQIVESVTGKGEANHGSAP
jgi:Rod binding domain-containing protein